MAETVNNVPLTPTFTPPRPQPFPSPEVSKGPSKFGRILGGIAGTALNLVVPGAGTAISGLFGTPSSSPDFSQMEVMLAQSAQQQMQMLVIQNKVQSQTQEFTTVTNLLKARHDSEMSAVHNFKS